MIRLGLIYFCYLFFNISAFAQPLLDSSREFNVAYAEDWPPYSFINSDKRADGILVLRLKEMVAIPLDLNISHRLLPWRRAQQSVEDGELDAMIAVPTLSRLEYAEVLGPIICEFKVSAYLARKSALFDELLKASQPLSVAGTSCVIMRGDKSALKIANVFGIECIEVTNLAQGIRMISSARSDVLIHDSIAVTDYIKNQSGEVKLADDIIEHPVALQTMQSRLMISVKSPFLSLLRDDLNRLYEIQQETRAETGILEFCPSH